MTSLNELASLLEAATALPWKECGQPSCACGLIWSVPADGIILAAHRGEESTAPLDANTALACAAVNALPLLLSLAAAAEALLAEDAHNGDANCAAGDCDTCPYRDRETQLRAAIDALRAVGK